jgi:hypothetical protein
MATIKYVIKFSCVSCERIQEVTFHPGVKVEKGEVIHSHAGGGKMGSCVFCRKSGLRALASTPKPKKGPVGWRKKLDE